MSSTSRLPAGSERHAFWFTPQGYALRCTLLRLFGRRWANLATLGVLSLSLTLPVLLLILLPEIQRISADGTRSPGLVAYLDTDLSELEGARLTEALANRADVAAATYISKAEALTELSERGDSEDAAGIAQTLEILGGNPLPGAIMINPATPSSTSAAASGEHKRLAQVLSANALIDRVDIDVEWVERLAAIRNFLSLVGWLFMTVLAVASIMVVSNTVRLELLRYSRESAVIHLLGGNRRFRNRSFIYLGALLGCVAGVLASVFAVIAILLLNVPVAGLVNSYGADFRLPQPAGLDVLKIVTASTLLGMVTAILTVRRSSSLAGLTHGKSTIQ